MSNLSNFALRSFYLKMNILWYCMFIFQCLLAVVYEQKQQIEQNEDESEVNNNEQQ